MTPSTFRDTARRMAPLSILLLSACASVPHLGPAPQVATPASFATDRSFPATGDAPWPAQDWWQGYGDAQLNTLIAEALAESPDLAAATARVAQAEGYAQQAGAARLPTLGVTGNVAVTKQSYNNGIPAAFVPKGWNDTGRVQGELGFDLDLWGRNRAGYAAARSDRAAAELDRAQVALTLSTNVADAYADLARLFAERAVAQAALEVRQQTATLTADRVTGGLDTRAELKQAQSAVPAARADLAATDEAIALTGNRIAALLGKGPDRGLSIAPPAATIAPRGVPANAATDLIARRPDIVAARTRVEAEASRIKVARADFYPSISLSAVFGLQSLGLSNLINGGSTTGSVGPALNLPIFRGGQLQGSYRVVRGTYDAAVADYDRTVTDAYRAVADAVVSQRALTTRLTESQQSLADAQAGYDVARLRYEGGLSRFTDVLVAQDRVLQARRAVTELQARAFTLDVALVRALGGGFSAPATARRSDKDSTHG